MEIKQVNIRGHVYDKLEYTRLMTQRQNRSLLGKHFDYLEAMENKAGMELQHIAVYGREEVEKKLKEVFDEFNCFGVIANNARYQISGHEQFAVKNLISRVSPLARQRMQDFLSHCAHEKSPYRDTNLGSTRWLLQGTRPDRPSPTPFWQQCDTMTAQKQPHFIDRINLLARTGSLQTCDVCRWSEEASYMCWAMEGFHALRDSGKKSEEELATLRRLILEGDYKQHWIVADALRDPDYKPESFPFWPSPPPGEAEGALTVAAQERRQLEDTLRNMTAEQRQREFSIDVASLVADTTDIIAHYAKVKGGKKTKALAPRDTSRSAECDWQQSHCAAHG